MSTTPQAIFRQAPSREVAIEILRKRDRMMRLDTELTYWAEHRAEPGDFDYEDARHNSTAQQAVDRLDHECTRDDLDYQGHYGAPGIGWHGVCRVCKRDWSVIGDSLHDPSEQAHVQGPEDVI